MAISFANGFGFESSWIDTALDVVPTDPTIFQGNRINDAMATFGIGNKKVEALASWLRGMRLVTGNVGNLTLSAFGRLVKMRDPRLQDPGTWWVLHFMLAIPSTGTSQDLWQWYSNEPFLMGYDLDELRSSAARAFPGAKERTIQTGLDEVRKSLMATPLGTLGLMLPDRSAGQGRFAKNEPSSLSLPVLLAGIAHQMTCTGRETLNVDEVTSLAGGAARVVNLPRSTTLRLLGEASALYGVGLVTVSQTAGLDSVWLFERSPLMWLAWHYAETAGEVAQAAEAKARRDLAEVEQVQ